MDTLIHNHQQQQQQQQHLNILSPSSASPKSPQLIPSIFHNQPELDGKSTPNVVGTGWQSWISETLTKNQRFHNLVYYRLGNLKYLADTLAETEPWGKELKILKIYLDNTFKRIVEENKIVAYFASESSTQPILLIFNTGLLSKSQEEIYCILQSIAVASARDKEQESGGRRCEERQWILKEFLPTSLMNEQTVFDKYSSKVISLSDLPDRAHYFVDGVEHTSFDPAIPIDKDGVDFASIIKNSIQSKIDRLPQEYVFCGDKELLARFNQGIGTTITRVRSNPRCAVPQFHRDNDGNKKIDLLLPISMCGKKEPDCSLVVRLVTVGIPTTPTSVPPPPTYKNKYYQVRGILSKEDSYINARVIQKIDQKWLDYYELVDQQQQQMGTPILMGNGSNANTPNSSVPNSPNPNLLAKQNQQLLMGVSNNKHNNNNNNIANSGKKTPNINLSGLTNSNILNGNDLLLSPTSSSKSSPPSPYLNSSLNNTPSYPNNHSQSNNFNNNSNSYNNNHQYKQYSNNNSNNQQPSVSPLIYPQPTPPLNLSSPSVTPLTSPQLPMELLGNQVQSFNLNQQQQQQQQNKMKSYYNNNNSNNNGNHSNSYTSPVQSPALSPSPPPSNSNIPSSPQLHAQYQQQQQQQNQPFFQQQQQYSKQIYNNQNNNNSTNQANLNNNTNPTSTTSASTSTFIDTSHPLSGGGVMDPNSTGGVGQPNQNIMLHNQKIYNTLFDRNAPPFHLNDPQNNNNRRLPNSPIYNQPNNISKSPAPLHPFHNSLNHNQQSFNVGGPNPSNNNNSAPFINLDLSGTSPSMKSSPSTQQPVKK